MNYLLFFTKSALILLLTSGAIAPSSKKEKPDFDQTQQLVKAIKEGSITNVVTLLAAKADPNQEDYQGCLPLFHACKATVEFSHKNSDTIVSLLLAYGARPSLSPMYGQVQEHDTRTYHPLVLLCALEGEVIPRLKKICNMYAEKTPVTSHDISILDQYMKTPGLTTATKEFLEGLKNKKHSDASESEKKDNKK